MLRVSGFGFRVQSRVHILLDEVLLGQVLYTAGRGQVIDEVLYTARRVIDEVSSILFKRGRRETLLLLIVTVHYRRGLVYTARRGLDWIGAHEGHTFIFVSCVQKQVPHPRKVLSRKRVGTDLPRVLWSHTYTQWHATKNKTDRGGGSTGAERAGTSKAMHRIRRCISRFDAPCFRRTVVSDEGAQSVCVCLSIGLCLYLGLRAPTVLQRHWSA